MRPILGNYRGYSLSDNWSSSNGLLARKRMESWSSSDGSTSATSPDVSPIGSPFKLPSLSLKPNYNLNSNESFELQRLCQQNNPRQDFESNGRDVPLENNNCSMNWRNPILKDYQLFNGFNYAQLKPSALPSKPKVSVTPTYTRMKKRVKSQTFCTFCKNNNETPDTYNSHVVKDMFGITRCPVLRKYNCPKCNSGGGDNGHTLRYCPLNRPGADNYQPSIIKMLKSSRSADGKIKGQQF